MENNSLFTIWQDGIIIVLILGILILKERFANLICENGFLLNETAY